MACGLTDPQGCVAEVAGGVGKQVAGDVFEEIAQSFAGAAKDATAWLWATMGQATAVGFGGSGWRRDLGITITLALVIGVGLFLVQVIASGLRQDFGGMGRAVRGVVIAWGAGAVAIAITESLLYVADQLSQGIMQAGAGTSSWQAFGQKILAATEISSIATPSATAAVVLLISLVIVAASVVVWAALMVRKLLLIIAAIFAPVAFAGAQADVTASWVRKWIEVTLALIASKIILVTIFVIGLGVLADGVGQASVRVGSGQLAQDTTQVVVGALILCIAGFAPWLALKMVHFAGDSFHTIHAQAQGVGRGARAAAQVPQKFRETMQLGAAPRSPGSSGDGVGQGGSWQTRAPSTSDRNRDGEPGDDVALEDMSETRGYELGLDKGTTDEISPADSVNPRVDHEPGPDPSSAPSNIPTVDAGPGPQPADTPTGGTTDR